MDLSIYDFAALVASIVQQVKNGETVDAAKLAQVKDMAATHPANVPYTKFQLDLIFLEFIKYLESPTRTTEVVYACLKCFLEIYSDSHIALADICESALECRSAQRCIWSCAAHTACA